MRLLLYFRHILSLLRYGHDAAHDVVNCRQQALHIHIDLFNNFFLVDFMRNIADGTGYP
ncbi:hypothetical protein D3C77_756790 [compost metagenome]